MVNQALTILPSLGEGNHGVPKRTNGRAASDRLIVTLEFSIRADARSLFHALTVPEYIETWINFPGDHPGCKTLAAKVDQDYIIEHHCEGKTTLRVTGEYSSCQRHNLSFSWNLDGVARVTESRVDIRLRGDFGKTALWLRHSGFVSQAQSAWHRTMWAESIRRLIGLYDAPLRRDDSAQSRARYRRPVPITT